MIEVTRKSIYKLTRDVFKFVNGTEGVWLDLATIKLFPGMSDEERARIYSLELGAKRQAEYLLLINNELLCVPVEDVEFVRYEPPFPIFEDDEDHAQWVDERINNLLNRGGENAST